MILKCGQARMCSKFIGKLFMESTYLCIAHNVFLLLYKDVLESAKCSLGINGYFVMVHQLFGDDESDAKDFMFVMVNVI